LILKELIIGQLRCKLLFCSGYFLSAYVSSITAYLSIGCCTVINKIKALKSVIYTLSGIADKTAVAIILQKHRFSVFREAPYGLHKRCKLLSDI
jgi:hypothetical protein